MPNSFQPSRTALEFIILIAEDRAQTRSEKTKLLRHRDQECVDLGIAHERRRLQQVIRSLSEQFSLVKTALAKDAALTSLGHIEWTLANALGAIEERLSVLTSTVPVSSTIEPKLAHSMQTLVEVADRFNETHHFLNTKECTALEHVRMALKSGKTATAELETPSDPPLPYESLPADALYWARKAKQLWQILDDIDTLGDSIKPGHSDGSAHRYFQAVQLRHSKRHDVLRGDLLERIPDGDSVEAFNPPHPQGRELLVEALRPGGVLVKRQLLTNDELGEVGRLTVRFLLELDERVSRFERDAELGVKCNPEDEVWSALHAGRGSGVVKEDGANSAGPSNAELWSTLRGFYSRCQEVFTDAEAAASEELEKRIANT